MILLHSPTEEAAKRRAEIAASLHQQFSRLTRELRNVALPQGMTPERLSALSRIDGRGPISITALARQEMVQPATMSRMVSTLADDGLVKRSEDKDDARGVLVTTTPRGRRMHQRANEQRQRYFAEALKYLNDEELVAMRALTIQLERFTLMLDARD